MKLKVEGIEEIEITDPAGLCNPQPSQAMPGIVQGPGQPQPQPQLPNPSHPRPPVPTPFSPLGDPRLPRIPGAGDVTIPQRPSGYYRRVSDPDGAFPRETKWGVGGEAIQRAGQQLDPPKWEKNWQASMGERNGG